MAPQRLHCVSQPQSDREHNLLVPQRLRWDQLDSSDGKSDCVVPKDLLKIPLVVHYDSIILSTQ